MRGEKALYLFLETLVDAPGVLSGLKLHDHQAREFDQKCPDGLVIGNGVFTPADGEGGVDEYDDCFFLTAYARVQSRDKTERSEALDRADEIAKAVARAIYNDRSLGGRVCTCLVGRAEREFSNPSNADKYVYVHLPIVINESGTTLPAPFNQLF